MKEKMIFFEKCRVFNEQMYNKFKFSEFEISSLKNNGKLNKMFEVMEIETELNVFSNLFACMISNIIYQQVAFKVARYSEVMLFDYLQYDVSPEAILKIDDKTFKRFKIFGKRMDYIRNFANFTVENQSFFSNIDTYSEEEIFDILIKIPGIGNWSIEMFFIFGLTKNDILSLQDLIIVKGLKRLYGEVDLTAVKAEINDYATITSVNLWKFIEKEFYKQIK